MSDQANLPRRNVVAGLAGIGAVLTSVAAAEQIAATGTPVSPPPTLRSPQLGAVAAATAECAQAGRACLARCTDHLAAGMSGMAACQRAVMNMLAVTSAMADVAGYANAAPEDVRSLAATCARFCTACAEACEPHAMHHEECRACRDACMTCARACATLAE